MENKIKSTVIGSFPQPDYLKIPTWFKNASQIDYQNSKELKEYNQYLKNPPYMTEYNVIKGIKELIEFQTECGCDVITDGELKRENYINYHLRYLEGINFDDLKLRNSRNGAYKHEAPVIRSQIQAKKHFLANDWAIAQLFTTNTVKATLPGPMTIWDNTYNDYYVDIIDYYEDISKALNFEILELVKQGCKYIQIDEPLLCRNYEEGLKNGIKYLNACFKDVPQEVTKVVHLCCGYPELVDDPNYIKADGNVYFKLAKDLDSSNIDEISIEQAHAQNDLSQLLPLFKNKKIILGLIQIACTYVETVEQIKSNIREALKYIPPERLIVGPDCGFGLLSREIAEKKLKNLCQAAKEINQELANEIKEGEI